MKLPDTLPAFFHNVELDFACQHRSHASLNVPLMFTLALPEPVPGAVATSQAFKESGPIVGPCWPALGPRLTPEATPHPTHTHKQTTHHIQTTPHPTTQHHNSSHNRHNCQTHTTSYHPNPWGEGTAKLNCFLLSCAKRTQNEKKELLM